jgi:hypothetical protein
VVGPSPRSGDTETPPEAEVGSELWGRARQRPPSEVEVEAEPWGRARRIPPSEVEVEAEPWGRARRRPPPVAPEAGLSCCQPHPSGWHSSRRGASSAVFRSGRSVEGRSDCGHFDLAD